MKERWQRLPRWGRWTISIFALLIVLAAVVPSEEDESGSTASENASSEQAAAPDGAGDEGSGDDDGSSCGNVATSDCTPHVGPDGSVRVDALIWSIDSVRTAKSLGDQQYGLGETADGQFVIAKLRVRSDKDESATLAGDVWQLEVDGNTYDTDSDGMVAAMGIDDDPFFLDDIGPDSTTTGTVVFDLPPSVLSKKLELRFNELGFGDGHGYIELPSLR